MDLKKSDIPVKLILNLISLRKKSEERNTAINRNKLRPIDKINNEIEEM